MEMYLTTTDNVIRARGTLLLAEVLGRLASKPLGSAIIHSLIGFFTDRLADWRALRGALVGCLALLRRKSDVGVVSSTDAKAVAEVYLKTLQVQSLGQHDRKLCFQLLECVLQCYPNEVASLVFFPNSLIFNMFNRSFLLVILDKLPAAFLFIFLFFYLSIKSIFLCTFG
ncbi:MMS19 nucleotide excision repair protein homolog isoform X1 [Humulus lupulus]|uniref:MMS19 nucleotide excision repair protein homolog isoform X1 n=1 Tax=Humulus lupulus TaxID=3486 RepID=UPI002B401560|nr:MMS19 nucleotide excision repair protein homolog isoform X1 [Humulus lupulus]